MSTTPRYRFGPFDLDPVRGDLCRNGAKVKLQDLPYRLLLMLVERPGEIVTREEVRQRLWPENTFVEFDNSLGVAIRKVREALGDDADSPRYVETLPRRGYRFVAPVRTESSALEQVPTVAAPVIESPGNIPQAISSATTSPPLVSRVGAKRYWPIPVMVATLVGAVLYLSHSPPRPAAASSEARSLTSVRRSVAVLGFRNLTGRAEDEWISPAVTEMLHTELAAGGGLRLVSGEDVARAKRELSLFNADSLAKGSLERLRNNPGADAVVLGSVTLLPGQAGKQIRLDVRLQDTQRGETLMEQAFTGSEQDLFDLSVKAGALLRQSLGVEILSTDSAGVVRASLPANQAAARFYAEGRAKLWAFDFHSARDLLVKAIAADPNYSLAHAALSEALWHSGYIVKARAEAQRALDLSRPLSQEDRLLVQGQYARSLPDWPKSVEAYETLYRLHPDSLDYGLLLASAQSNVKPEDSLRTLQSLRRLPPPVGDDARIDMQEASSWMNVDIAKASEAAHRAIAKATAQGSHAIAARTYGFLCQASAATGDSVEGVRNCTDAMQSSTAAGDLNSEAMMRIDLAAIRFQMGDVALSEDMFRTAIREFREVGNLEGVATSEGNLAAALIAQGSLPEARRLTEDSITHYREIDEKDGLSLALTNLAELRRETGNLNVAETTFQQAKATAQEIDDNDGVAYALNGLGDVLTDRGDLSGARQNYDQALARRTKSGEKQLACETQVSLARISIEEGHPAEAEPTLHGCKEQFHAEKQADDEVAASTLLIQALLAEDKVPEALEETKHTAPLAAKGQTLLTQLKFSLIEARAGISSENAKRSRISLDRILQDARRHDFLEIEFETQLARAELDLKTGDAAAARTRMAALAKSAAARGFGLIARRATDQGDRTNPALK